MYKVVAEYHHNIFQEHLQQVKNKKETDQYIKCSDVFHFCYTKHFCAKRCEK